MSILKSAWCINALRQQRFLSKNPDYLCAPAGTVTALRRKCCANRRNSRRHSFSYYPVFDTGTNAQLIDSFVAFPRCYSVGYR